MMEERRKTEKERCYELKTEDLVSENELFEVMDTLRYLEKYRPDALIELVKFYRARFKPKSFTRNYEFKNPETEHLLRCMGLIVLYGDGGYYHKGCAYCIAQAAIKGRIPKLRVVSPLKNLDELPSLMHHLGAVRY